MKVDKAQFDALLRSMIKADPTKSEDLKTGEKKKAETVIPPKPSRRK